VLAACRPVKQVSALGKQIGQEFQRPILVSVAHRSQLILVIPPAKLDSTQRDTTDPASLARHVAEYAVAHYQNKASLKSVTVIFDAGDSDSTTFGNYTWSADELSGKSRAAAGTPGEKSD
jgi:hypothetical protein